MFRSLEKPESLGCLSKILHTSCGLVLKTSILGVFQIHRPPSVGSIELISCGLKSISECSFQHVHGWVILFINSSQIHEGTNQLPSLVSHIFFNSSLRYLDTNIEGWEGSVQANKVLLELWDIGGLSICTCIVTAT